MFQKYRRFWRLHRTKRVAMVLVLAFGSLGSVAYGLAATHHAQPSTHYPAHIQPSSHHVAKLKRTTKPSQPTAPPPPKPIAPPPTPAPTPSIPTPKRATNASQSPAAVASSNTSPGTGVSGLTPTASSPAPTAQPVAPASNDPSPTPPATCVNTPESYGSTNWAGYLRTGCNFTAISGAWTVPTPTTTSTTDVTTDAAWIGIGGVSTNDLIQVGTEETVDTDGTINAAVFYELLPDMPHYPTNITVVPGDRMSASLSETTADQWVISITDATSGQAYTQTVSYASSHSSAEWIEEDPSYSDGTLVPFDNFGTVTFTGSSSTGNGVTSTLADASDITLVDQQGHPLAVPSAVTGTRSDTFSVTRHM